MLPASRIVIARDGSSRIEALPKSPVSVSQTTPLESWAVRRVCETYARVCSRWMLRENLCFENSSRFATVPSRRQRAIPRPVPPPHWSLWRHPLNDLNSSPDSSAAGRMSFPSSGRTTGPARKDIRRSAAKELGVECSIERSRSGNGAHAWIFFSEPVPARDARQLGTAHAHGGIADMPGFRPAYPLTATWQI